MIKHSVVFSLNCAKGSEEEKLFFKAAMSLAALPGVGNFEALKQVSSKNNYDFGLSMEFTNQSQYDSYNLHPSHVQFIRQYWIPYVKEFLEIDYESLVF